MSRASQSARRKARKDKSRKRRLNEPTRQERKQRKETAEADREKLDQQKWRGCIYHGCSVKKSEILIFQGAASFLSLDDRLDPIQILGCGECGGEWWHTTTHP